MVLHPGASESPRCSISRPTSSEPARLHIRRVTTLWRPWRWAFPQVTPVPAARLPYRVKLSAGKHYAWCACGHSKKQPFCDGTHRTEAPSIAPLRFTADKDRTALLCACKQTKNAPYCDGSHLKVIYRDVVKSLKGIFK
uniref:Iron-binding zinc finger CDGSH type domain-containing protein n=1 Tax=Amphilophus citrinellus TaxID=61819 RepID=A0A3Q0T286_AMPCI